ncbi:hypothetical protein I308_100724 [Cryptococcus tetragattii IND107]|uniref:Uncharacterized protein n=1 Tax=Cryptococcus tetragattii IND107 TaxID=1296105 RepID=A0ABR3C5L4_9TREE
MVPKITSTSSMKTKHIKRASCRARSKIPLTPPSLVSPPLPPNIRSTAPLGGLPNTWGVLEYFSTELLELLCSII